MLELIQDLHDASPTGGTTAKPDLYFREGTGGKMQIFAHPVGWDLAGVQALKQPGLAEDIAGSLSHNRTMITGGVLRDQSKRPVKTDGVLGIEAARIQGLGEGATAAQKSSFASVQGFFEKLSFPNASVVQTEIEKIQGFSQRPRDAKAVRDALLKQIDIEQIMARADVPNIVKETYKQVTSGAPVSQILPNDRYVYDAIKIFMGVGKAEGEFIAEGEVVNPETVVVDDINQIYKYLDGGRVYPAILSAEDTLNALKQIVPKLTADPEFKKDLKDAGGKPDDKEPTEIPINSFTIDGATNTATLNITNAGRQIDLIIATDPTSENGITIDIKDPGFKDLAKTYAPDSYTLISSLPTLLRKHINRNLRFKSVSGFGIQEGKFIFKGGPRAPAP